MMRESVRMILKKDFCRMKKVASTTILLLCASSTLAAVTCPANFVSDEFATSDYTSLAPVVSPPAPRANESIIGIKNESYLIASNTLSTSGTLDTGGTNIYQSSTTGGIQVFQFFQDFANKTSTRTASYTFKNKFSNQPQALTNVGISIYDIDSSYVGRDLLAIDISSFLIKRPLQGLLVQGRRSVQSYNLKALELPVQHLIGKRI